MTKRPGMLPGFFCRINFLFIFAFLKKNLGTYTLGRAAISNEKGVIKYEVVAASRGHKGIYVFDKDGKFLVRERNHKGKEQAKPVTTVTPAGKKAEEKTAPVKK